MEEETQTHPKTGDITSSRRPWSFQTNWTISQGSLDASVTVETSDLPIQSDNSTPKPPLVLQPSSSGSGPCEIKISFTQKHEIRQVYVRSTARVYEIYHASSAQSDDEYLCTVRCSIADREGDLLHTSDIEGASTGEPAEVKKVGGINNSPREDDWVEVKIPTATRRNFRDFYEATAEISDVDPCMSITLRLLSLQSKGCVYVDEVYVFADAVESVDSEHQTVQEGNSANLMAMLVPTLMQLSKSRVNGLENNRASSSKEKQKYHEFESGESSTTKTSGLQHVGLHESQLETKVKLQDTYRATLEPNHFQVPEKAPKSEKSDTVSKNDHSGVQVERVLEQLVSRMSRIEDICLKFEEKMVKPINSMLDRLERVEQQVDVLAKNSSCPRLPSGTIFSAPDFSNESNSSSSFNTEGSNSQSCGPSEIEKKNITTAPDISSQPDDKSTSVSVPRFLPSLTVTAPEFSCCDDEEENNVVEPQKVISQEKPKQTLSIDDALAAALARFSSTNLVPNPMDTKAFTTTTPEFTTEDNGGDVPLECFDPPVIQPSSELTDDDEALRFKVTAPEFTGEEKGNVEEIIWEKHSVSTSTHNVDVEVEGNSEAVDCPFAEDDDDYRFTEGPIELEKNNLTGKISVSDSSDILKQLPLYQTSNSSDVTHGSDNALFGGKEIGRDTETVFDTEIASVITRPSYPSIVDFEIPILDVKFTSRDISSPNSTLEALLDDVTETSPRPENDVNLISREMNLDSVENGDGVSSRGENENDLLVELDGYVEEEGSIDLKQDHQTGINQETFESLI